MVSRDNYDFDVFTPRRPGGGAFAVERGSRCFESLYTNRNNSGYFLPVPVISAGVLLPETDALLRRRHARVFFYGCIQFDPGIFTATSKWIPVMWYSGLECNPRVDSDVAIKRGFVNRGMSSPATAGELLTAALSVRMFHQSASTVLCCIHVVMPLAINQTKVCR